MVFFMQVQSKTPYNKALLLLLKLLLAQEQQLLESVRNAKGQVTTGETALSVSVKGLNAFVTSQQCKQSKYFLYIHVSAVSNDKLAKMR